MTIPSPLTEIQAMGALDHMSGGMWNMASMGGQVYVTVTGRIGPLSFVGRTRKDALNSAVYALRNERIDHADTERRTA
jgi:hypothetical protein